MVGLEDSIRSLLIPSDEPKYVLECLLLPSKDNVQDKDETKDPSSLQHQRIVAVIVHKEQSNGWEEGSVFVLKRKLFSSSTSNELEIHRMFPVYGDFTITMAQLPQDFHNSHSANFPRSRFKVTINPGQSLVGNEPLDLVTDDVSALKNVLAECRRLKELSEIAPEVNSPTQTYSWLAPYTTNNNNNIFIPPLFTVFTVPSSFPDLRNLNQSLYSRLSSASTGTPGDESNDIVLIRDEWAHSRARNQCRRGRVRLEYDFPVFVRPQYLWMFSLRLGTFNVNGKMPTQDLAAWLRGGTPNARTERSLEHGLLPAVKGISPLSLGEVVKDPFDARHNGESTASLVSSSESSTTRASVPDIPIPLESPEVPLLSISENSDSTQSDPNPDILVLGFEELDLSTEALLYSTSSAREDAWTLAVFAALGEKAEMYEKLASKQLVGMLIMVIVKKSLRTCFSDIMTSSVGAGILGLMGNKGGTAIRLAFTPPASGLENLDTAFNNSATSEQDYHGVETPGPTVFTFVVSHLAAFDEMVTKRNADFHELSKRLVFDSSGGLTVSQSLVSVPEKFGVFETDILFWMVSPPDLNYRINLPDTDVRTVLSSKSWKNRLEVLTHFDQLRTAIREKKAFEIFHEHDIHHLPTYRFSGGVVADTLGYDVKRKPAWTDRILYAFSPLTARVTQSSYSGHGEITMSDHRPISANFNVDVDIFDKDQLHATAANLFRQVQGMEDLQERAKTKLSQTSIDMYDIYYKRKKTAGFTFQNYGKVPLSFRFLPVGMYGELFPAWLSVSHTTGLLLPNERIEITLTAYVDNMIASRLNLGPRDLNCTLIIHTLMGKDHFVAINAKYQYTCFANKLSRLTRLPGPIRSIKSHNDLLTERKAINAPREIMRLVNWLMTCAHPTDDLFTVEADSDIVDDIREYLDTGNEFPYSQDTRERSIPIAFGGALMELLKSLPEYIVPKELHGRCVAAADRDEAFEILDAFPPETVNVWISITAFLHYIVQSSPLRAETIGMFVSAVVKYMLQNNFRLAATFAPIFFGFLRTDLPSSTDTTPSAITPLGYQKFIMYFIQ
ncbi:DNase I-like protein [Lentinula aciculospora]|uniref:DNase I-like protein n=1 Tax=Lentinula aciculospora TaxID=153920 RepID=A0A9W9DPF5_9AGAR|nr:DNase I-like protein [Lentinula aciculospora]